MTKQIQSWKNADNASSDNSPVTNVIIDSDIMSRVVGGQQEGGFSEDYKNPQLEALVKALSSIRFIF
jgi:hypothetical protein